MGQDLDDGPEQKNQPDSGHQPALDVFQQAPGENDDLEATASCPSRRWTSISSRRVSNPNPLAMPKIMARAGTMDNRV